ncbi:MAG: cysteine desulfurase family protein [Bacteroidetes bacterium]|nr:cysteine desulfurase family protein [Bacteroidota bacterium]
MSTLPRVYLDNAATTPISEEVLDAMIPVMKAHFGNPSSSHADGRKVKGLIEEARSSISTVLHCAPGEIFFTSGGTESDNLILRGSVSKLGIKHIVSSPIEHHAVLHTIEHLHRNEGVAFNLLAVHENGHINMDHLKELLMIHPHTLVSLMHANNEIGNMIDIETIGNLVHQAGGIFHSDTVQTIGHYPFDLNQGHIDFMAAAAHKFNGPKGIGFAYINKKHRIGSQITGGSQERDMRGGTENVHGIVGLAKALEIAYRDMEKKKSHVSQLKQAMIDLLRKQIPDIQFNGDPEGESLYTVLSVSFPPNEMGSMLLFNLDLAGISASGGSACSSGASLGSHVLHCIKPNSDRTTVRFSFGLYNTMGDIQYTIEKLALWYGNAH